jgi:transposase
LRYEVWEKSPKNKCRGCPACRQAGKMGNKVVATFCYTINTNSELFIHWFRTILIKSIPKGVTVILDNASFHPKKKLRNLARRHGVKILFLPPYSPDLNPIEKVWENIKKALVDILNESYSLSNAIYYYFGCKELLN